MENRTKLNNILNDAVNIITDPGRFYRGMPRTGGFADPVIFVLVMALIMGLSVAIFSLFGASPIGAAAVGIGAIIIIPIFALIGSFIGAAVLFVIWKLMGSSESYETAYRCAAYAAAIYPITALLSLLPYLGSIIGIAWGMYLMITASVEIHQLAKKSALMVFGILGSVMIVINVGSEMAARRIAFQAEEMGKQFEAFGRNFGQQDNLTPEEAGKAMGDFLSGMAAATAEKNRQQQEQQPNTAPVALDQPITTPPATTTSTTSDNVPASPEEAGRALGDFLKGFSEATSGLGEQMNGDSADSNVPE